MYRAPLLASYETISRKDNSTGRLCCSPLFTLPCWPCRGSRCSRFHLRLIAMRRSRSSMSVSSRGCARIAWLRNLHFFAQRVFQLLANVRIFLQENARILAPLSHAFAAKAEPRSALLQQPLVHAKVDQITFA